MAGGSASAIAPQDRNKEAVAETIENNVRSKITKERVADPAFYNKMSTLLDEIIAALDPWIGGVREDA